MGFSTHTFSFLSEQTRSNRIGLVCKSERADFGKQLAARRCGTGRWCWCVITLGTHSAVWWQPNAATLDAVWRRCLHLLSPPPPWPSRLLFIKILFLCFKFLLNRKQWKALDSLKRTACEDELKPFSLLLSSDCSSLFFEILNDLSCLAYLLLCAAFCMGMSTQVHSEFSDLNGVIQWWSFEWGALDG